ncbi:riboflavin synthase [bacterium]|nr:riboflavin synthase [bacterium]
MFTGLIQDIGKVTNVKPVGRGRQVEIFSPKLGSRLNVGDSVAVDGACLTVVKQQEQSFLVDVVEETLQKTTLANLQPTMLCNLELPLAAGDHFGGHFVQGHVDGVGKIIKFYPQTYEYWLTVQVPADLLRFVVNKGSISIDGISLTVALVENNEVSISVIPYTYTHTTLQFKKIGDMVNIEVDVLAKYVERLLATRGLTKPEISEDWLRDLGY